MSKDEIEIYEAEHQPQLEELWLRLYGNFNGSQDDNKGWDGK